MNSILKQRRLVKSVNTYNLFPAFANKHQILVLPEILNKIDEKKVKKEVLRFTVNINRAKSKFDKVEKLTFKTIKIN